MNFLLEKTIDVVFDLVVRFFVYILKVISPVKVSPKEIPGQGSTSRWVNISDIKIENRLSTDLYDILIAGISKDFFSIKIISDDGTKGKTVEHMGINTNHLVIEAKDSQTNNHLWIFRVHKLGSKEALNLHVKIENKQTIYFKTLNHSSVEVTIKERDDGAVAIPLKIGKIPKIK